MQFVPIWGPALCSTSPLIFWSPHISLESQHLISAHRALSNMRGIDSVVKSGEHLLLQECFNEEVGWVEPDLCFFTRLCVDTLIITIPFTQLEQMTAVALYICASVSDLICVWSGCCIFMWLCGHLVWQAVCFKIGWSPKERLPCCLLSVWFYISYLCLDPYGFHRVQDFLTVLPD